MNTTLVCECTTIAATEAKPTSDDYDDKNEHFRTACTPTPCEHSQHSKQTQQNRLSGSAGNTTQAHRPTSAVTSFWSTGGGNRKKICSKGRKKEDCELHMDVNNDAFECLLCKCLMRREMHWPYLLYLEEAQAAFCWVTSTTRLFHDSTGTLNIKPSSHISKTLHRPRTQTLWQPHTYSATLPVWE